MNYEQEEIPDISELVQVREGETGDVIYANIVDDPYERKNYILKDNDTSNDLILITESWGEAAYLNDSWMGGSREVFAVEELESGNYIIAIKEIINDQWSNGERITWQTIETNSSGVLDWNTSIHTENIRGSEILFNEDLNNDGAVGVDTSNLILKTTDNVGDILAVDDNNSLFIVTSDNVYIPVVEEWSGGSIILDENQDFNNGDSFKREALYVGLDNKGTDDTSDDRYSLAVKETNTNSWGGQTHTNEQWVIYDVKTDGSFDWMGSYGVEISDYETIFDQDIDGDGSKGIDLSNLEKISTDTVGVELKRGFGSLYIVDGDTTLKVREEYGNPGLEESGSWEGGEFSKVGYAAEKLEDGSYALVIKFTETFNVNFGDESSTPQQEDLQSAETHHVNAGSGSVGAGDAGYHSDSVSYTHLTLPTICSV